MLWTNQKIQATPAKKLKSLMENCFREIERGSEKSDEAKDVWELIEKSGRLKESSSDPIGLPENDPKVQEMRAIIEGDNALSLMLKAAEQGLPAIRYVDLVLQEELGEWYGNRYHSTATAGHYVGEAMRDLGFTKTGTKKLPDDCIAKTASVFVKN